MTASTTVFKESVESCIFPIDPYVTGFRCVWTIEDYMEINKEAEFNKFSAMKHILNLPIDKPCKWLVVLFPRGANKEGEAELYFGFDRENKDLKYILSAFKLSILRANGNKSTISEEFCQGSERLNNNISYCAIIKFPAELISPDKYLVNGSLIILLEGAVSAEVNAVEGGKIEDNNFLQYRLTNLNSALKQLKFQSIYSDVTFSVDDEQFELHKNVLANNSEVFDEMFSKKEEVKNIIPLKDITSDVFRELVHFIYTNSVTHNFQGMGLELLKTADIYKVRELKRLCEVNLSNTIGVDNAASYFVAAHNHSANNLKKKSSEVIRENWDEVQKTEGWKELKNNPELLIYLMNLSFSKQ